MTNDAPKLAAGVAVSLATAAVSRADQIEQFVRIMSGVVSIAAGLVVIYFQVKNRKKKNNNKHP